MERDPILFFDELTLYESELDDNGESSVTLKIRVMPKCWFVLMRFWMRCDGVRVRLRETRFFCPMASSAAAAAAKPTVIRESARRDESFEELRARGAPGDASQYPDADEAAAVLLAAGGPVEMAYHEIEHE
jgi:type 2A phosphatase activator TIP41